MSLSTFKEAIHHFVERVRGSLDLQKDRESLISHRRTVISWIMEETAFVRDEQEKEKKNQHILSGILAFTGLNQPCKKLTALKSSIERLKIIMKKNPVQFEASEIEDMELPAEVADSLRKLNGVKLPEYYGIVSGPLMKACYLRSRQDFDNCLKRSVNNLKFISLGSQPSNVVKFQRVLVQQLFGRLFNRENELSMIIKIEVEKDPFDRNIEIFCYVEDLLQKNKRIFKDLDLVKTQGPQLTLNNNEAVLRVDDMSILSSFLTQMLMVPLQTIVSDYVVEVEDKSARMLKMHRSLSASELEAYVREHPSLRNPLFYFYDFIKGHEYSTSEIKQSLGVRQLYGNFYEILSLLLQFIKNDFNFRGANGKMNSLAISEAVFRVVWKIFHDLMVLPNWIEEVISPIKETITLYEINGKIAPIFNEILKIQKESYEEYRRALLLLPIQNYLTLNVSKINIERYKDLFVHPISVEYVNCHKPGVFEAIFGRTIKDYSLTNTHIYEALYFLNFYARANLRLSAMPLPSLHPSWKNKRLWKQIVQIRNNEALPYLSISLDILALHLDFDSLQHSINPFASLENDAENDELFERVDILTGLLQSKFEKKSQIYLSYLIEKAFRYKKYKLVEHLIRRGVHVRNYDEIFVAPATTRDSFFRRSEERDKLKELMRQCEPQMFRKYQWEELLGKLRQKNEHEKLAVLKTLRRGQFYADSDIYSHLTSGSSMNDTLSRRDYMFAANRLIAKLDLFGSAAYVQVTQYPLLRQFYTFFLERLGKGSLSLNFCGFFTEKGSLAHLVECMSQCFTFEKGISSYSEAQLKSFTNQNDICEAILISIILMPTNVLLRNIIVSSEVAMEGGLKQDRKSLFVLDLHDFYQKNGFEANAGNVVLKVKNSLFLLNEMNNQICEKLIRKYASLDVLEFVHGLFRECSAFISEANAARPKNMQLPQSEQQLYTLIFQDGFAQAMAQRMFKIKTTFDKCLKNKTSLNPLKLLELIDPSLSYYYCEIIKSSNNLLERERMMLDDGFKKSLIVNEKLTDFLSNSSNVEQVRDSFPNHYRRFGFQGPTENLQNLHRNIMKFNIYTQKVSELKEYSHDVIEYFIRHVDLSGYTKEEREALVTRIQEYSREYLQQGKGGLPLSVVRINNIDGIREKTLKFSDERLREFILEDAKCADGELNNLLKKYHSMRDLILKGVVGLQRIGEYLVSLSDTLYLKHLKYLSITGCHDLVNVDLKCDQLQRATLRNNRCLSEIYIYSQKLKSMDCSECPKLRLENIGIYILKRVNVLICNYSCEGDVERLESKNYSVFLARILRYLFNRFEESNTYKFQLIITLIKLDLLNEKLFGFRGSQSYGKNLVNIVAKLGKEALSMVEAQIFDLFLRNSLIEELSVDELLKIEPSSLRSMESYLIRLNKLKQEGNRPFKKQFSSMTFKEFLKIPQLYIQHVHFFKVLAQCIEVDKTFRLHLSLSSEISLADYIEVICYFNHKENLEKLEIVFENSLITNDLLLYLFSLDTDKNKIFRLEFISCNIQIDEDYVISSQGFVKYLIFNQCTIKSLYFIESFNNLLALEINACLFAQKLQEVYRSFEKLEHLTSLSLVKLRASPHPDLALPQLFKGLQGLKRLQDFQFSGSDMSLEEVEYLSQQINRIEIYQLKFLDFYNGKQSKYIDSFLYHERLRIVYIELSLKTQDLLQSFINSLADNKSILKVNLKIDYEIPSPIFEKLKRNKVLEAFNCSQPIPNWLKNHIIQNTKGKSMIYQFDSFEPSVSSVNKNEDFYRIGLSLDGGGVRGLLLATQLDFLCRKVGKPIHKIFDCVGGTSIGGILALASTGSHDGNTPVCSTADLMDIFQLYGTKIFKKSQFGNIANIFQTKYDVRSFQALLSGYFKEVKLSEVLTDTNVVVTAVNRLTNQDVIFRSLAAIFDRNLDFYMRDIARATSAAPTFFPSAEIKNIGASQRYSLIDGGVGLNNPSKLVIDDIIKTTQNQAHKKNYFLLSLGTGRLINEAIPSNAGIKDLAPIIDSFTQSANYFIEKDLAENYRGHYLRVSPLINLLRKDGELDNTSPEVLKIYRDAGLEAAEQQFSNNIAFGKYKNQSLVEWLQENTDRKHEA